MRKIVVTMVKLVMLVALLGVASAQTVPQARISLVQDWSYAHVQSSRTSTLKQWTNLEKDPRALHNYLVRFWRPNFNSAKFRGPARRPGSPFKPPKTKDKNSKVDWALSLGTGGRFPTGQTPAKYQFDVTQSPNCANDFAVFPINATPNSTQANIVAVNNLYAGTSPIGQCGTNPTVMWSYKLGSSGIATSPVLSLDGKKVAIVDTGTTAILHVLTWATGQGTSSTAPYAGTPNEVTLDYTSSAGLGCTSTPAGDSHASPYVDYSTDSAFLAADNGILYHIKNIFGGVPTMDYCTVISANATLTSPVYDSGVNKVFISDGASVYSIDFSPTSGFANTKSITIAGANGITLSPTIDNSSQMIYVTSASDAGSSNSIVSQIPYSLDSHSDVNIGAVAVGPVFDGAFDNNFYTNTDPTTWTLYACGRAGGSGTKPALYGITFGANGVMNSTPLFSSNGAINPGGADGACSPLLEFYNGGVDRLFVSTTGSNTVSMFDITSRLTAASSSVASAAPYSGGTGSFAVDNNSSAPQASSIYFGTMGPSTTTCSTPVVPSPTIAHAAGSGTGISSTLTFTIPSAVTGSMIVVGIGGNSDTTTVSSVTDNGSGGSNTYMQIPGARSTANGLFTDFWVALKTTHDTATTINITYSGNISSRDSVVWVVNGYSTAALDVLGAISNGVPVGGISTGAGVTTTTANEFIAAFINTDGTITSNPAPGNEFVYGGAVTGNGDAGASHIAYTIGAHQPAWTDTGTAFASATVAFKESAVNANYCAVKLTQGALQ